MTKKELNKLRYTTSDPRKIWQTKMFTRFQRSLESSGEMPDNFNEFLAKARDFDMQLKNFVRTLHV